VSKACRDLNGVHVPVPSTEDRFVPWASEVAGEFIFGNTGAPGVLETWEAVPRGGRRAESLPTWFRRVIYGDNKPSFARVPAGMFRQGLLYGPMNRDVGLIVDLKAFKTCTCQEDHLRHAIEGLPQLQELIVRLVFEEGLSLQEAAERLRRPCNEIRKQYELAKERLDLGDREYDDNPCPECGGYEGLFYYAKEVPLLFGQYLPMDFRRIRPPAQPILYVAWAMGQARHKRLYVTETMYRQIRANAQRPPFEPAGYSARPGKVFVGARFAPVGTAAGARLLDPRADGIVVIADRRGGKTGQMDIHPVGTDPPGEEMEQQDLGEAFSRLPREQQHVLKLVLGEGLPLKEVAEKLRRPLNDVREGFDSGINWLGLDVRPPEDRGV